MDDLWRSDTVRAVQDGALAEITLDDGKANAMNPALIAAFDRALDSVVRSSARAMVIAGRPDFFCAGLDLKTWRKLTTNEARAQCVRSFVNVVMRVFTFPLPTVVALTGHALAGGAILALSADARVFCREPWFRFAINEVPLGVMLPPFALEVGKAVLPVALHVQMLLHGQRMQPSTMADHLFDSAGDAVNVVNLARTRAAELATLPPGAYAATKRDLRQPVVRAAMANFDTDIYSFVDSLNEALYRVPSK